MWTRLDDALLDHRKIFEAGDRLGSKDGPAVAFALYVVGLLWANKQVSDGFLPTAIVKRFPHVDKPLKVAAALAEAQLWEEVEGGYRIHDFHEFNYSAQQVQERRRIERDRRRRNGSAVGHRVRPGAGRT
jgi:hypothetical protein